MNFGLFSALAALFYIQKTAGFLYIKKWFLFFWIGSKIRLPAWEHIQEFNVNESGIDHQKFLGVYQNEE